MIDAHAHIQDERLSVQIAAVMDRARQASISGIVCCATQESDWQAVHALARQYPDTIIPCFGVHPWYLKDLSARWQDRLEDLVRTVASGVGEIGLDFALADFDEALQRDVFGAQLALARTYRRPVCIHCRKAWKALLEILQCGGPLEAGGIIHSYSGTEQYIPQLSSLGLSFSFSGSITRSNNKKGRIALSVVPLDRLLVETDSPDMLPFGMEGVNEPANLTRVINCVASLLGRSEGEIGRITADNARRIFLIQQRP